MSDTDTDTGADARGTRRRVRCRESADRDDASGAHDRGSDRQGDRNRNHNGDRTPDRHSDRNRERDGRDRSRGDRDRGRDDPVTRLQRTAGNRAVGAAVRGRRDRRERAGESRSGAEGDAERGVERGAESGVPSFPSGAGRPLPPETRSFFEGRFGRSLADVGVHVGPEAASVARALDADAVTRGSDVYFGAGRYRPDTAAGRGLLAHELAHTVQQSENASVRAGGGERVPAPSDPVERRARAATRRIAAGRDVDASALGAAPGVVARQSASESTPLVGPPRPARAESGTGGGDTDGERAAGPGRETANVDRIDLQGSATVDAAAIAERLGEEKRGTVPVKFGSLAAGEIAVRKQADGTYSTRGRESIPFVHPGLDPISGREGITPVLRVGLDSNQLGGFVSVAGAEVAEDSSRALVDWVAVNPALMGWAGLDEVAFPSVENTIEGGSLRLLASGFTFRLGGFMDGAGEFGLDGESVVFAADATVAVEGLTEAELALQRDASGALTGSVRVPVAYDQFEGEVFAEFGNGTVSMEGTASYTGEKFSGTATLLVTDAETATQVARQRLGPEAVRASAEESEGEAAEAGQEQAAGPTPGPRALAGYGTLEVHLTDWLAGTADVIVDSNGEVTVVGEVAPPAEITLFEQRDFVHEFPRIEVKAIYGVPVVGNLNVFANIGVDAVAKFGPGTLYDITLSGTYSTDPDVYQNYSLAATLNVSAFAGVRVRAEGGVGVTIIAHDLKAGVGVEGTAGIRGYVEARPTIGYREVADPSQGKTGQFFIAGHMEVAAQPTVGLAGDLFVELDSPWASPAPDKKWTWPIGELEYPLPGEFGIGADVDYVLGSGKAPDIEFGEVDFDSEKFMTDLMNDNVRRGAGAPKEKQGEFTDEGSADSRPPVGKAQSKGSGSVKRPPRKRDARSQQRPADRATGRQRGGEGDVPDPGVEKRWREGLRALMGVSEASERDPLTRAELKAELARIDRRYRFSTLRITESDPDWEVRAAMNPDVEVSVNAPDGDGGEGEGEREPGEAAEEGQLTRMDVRKMVRADLPRRERFPDWARRAAILVGGAATALAVVIGAAEPGAGRFRSRSEERERAVAEARALRQSEQSAATGTPPPLSGAPDLVRFEALVAEERADLRAQFAEERRAIDDRIRDTRQTIERLEARPDEIETLLRRVRSEYEARLATINEARERRFRKLERASDGPLDKATRDRVNEGYDAELDRVRRSMRAFTAEADEDIADAQSRIAELRRQVERLRAKRDEVDDREAAALEEFAATVDRRREALRARGARYTGLSAVAEPTGEGGGPAPGGPGGAGAATGGTPRETGRTGGPETDREAGPEPERGGRREPDRETERETGREAGPETERERDRGAGEGQGRTGGERDGAGEASTAGWDFSDVGEELDLEPFEELTGTVSERTRESVRLAREAGWIDEEGQPVRDEAGRVRGPGAAAQPHRRAGDVREELGVSGTGERAMESAHIVPQAFIRQLPGYTTGGAKTVLLPAGVHSSLDRTWKRWAKRERRAGETTTTIGEAYRALVRAIHRTSALSPDRQGALQQILDQELFSEHGFDPDRKIALPYPNLTPGESGASAPENAEKFPEVRDRLLGEPAAAVSEGVLDDLGYYRRSGTTSVQIVRKDADDAVYPKLTVDEESGQIILSSD